VPRRALLDYDGRIGVNKRCSLRYPAAPALDLVRERGWEMHWYVDVLKQYAVFDGRSTRSEYWFFALFNLIVIIVLEIIDAAIGTTPLLAGLYALAVLLPSLGVGIRRLHDTGRSGWWLLIALVPLVGAIVLIVFFVQESNPGDNSYGAQPLATPAM
jgi:uncharacterized membrane protein YhaH (DUF805 family)